MDIFFFLKNFYTHSDDLRAVNKLGKKVGLTTVVGSIQYDFLHLLC